MRKVSFYTLSIGLAFSALYVAALLSIRIMGFEYAVVVSDSMRPVAARGDLVLLKDVDGLARQDVVLFQRGEVLVLHRLIDYIDSGFWQTKGDANAVKDPWQLPPSDIKKEAVGVLKSFGIPMLWFGSESGVTNASAKYTSKAEATPNSVVAKMWNPPVMSWNTSGDATAFKFTNPAQTIITGTGERTFVSATTFPTNSVVRFTGRLTSIDATNPGLGIVLNACPNSSGKPTCGWFLNLHQTAGKARLRTINADGTFSAVLYEVSWPSEISLATNATWIIEKNSSNLKVRVNGINFLNLTNLNALATSNSVVPPTGNRSGIWLRATNTLNANPTVVKS